MIRLTLLHVLLLLTALSGTSHAVTIDPSPYPIDPSYCRLFHVAPLSQAGFQPKPYLGITYSLQKAEKNTPPLKENHIIRIDKVVPGSPAAKAGVRINDFIVSYTGKASAPADDLTAAFKKTVARHAAGDVFVLELLRGSERISLSVLLATAPTYYQAESDHFDIEKCAETSLLESTLRSSQLIERYANLRSGVDFSSRTILNPWSPMAPRVERLKPPDLLWMQRHPLSSGVVAHDISKSLTTPLTRSNWSLADTIRSAAGLLPAALPVPPQQDISFAGLLHAMDLAHRGVSNALRSLAPEEATLLREHGIENTENASWDRVVTASLKIDRRELLTPFAPLLSFFSKENLDRLKEDIIKRFGDDKPGVLHQADTKLGKVIVGGTGPSMYRDDAALILDLGGDDLYLNNAGGSRAGAPVSLVIDWGGNDRYIARQPFSQGAGILGGGFLLDLGGDDFFDSLDASQGAGYWGIGLLFHGDGRAAYSSRSFSQGTGEMGIGLSVSMAGTTSYLSLLAGQGLGLFGGAGILIDIEGNDLYRIGGLQPDIRDPKGSSVSMGQGFGQGIRSESGFLSAPGGIGILIDTKGDDFYSADYFAQGSSYYHALGLLDDRGGNDTYIAGRYAQGAGVHSAVGVLLDQAGSDSYLASFGVSQGVGHDYGIGLLDDQGGDDDYRGGELVQGAATNGSLGMLVDFNGNDRYGCDKNCKAFAGDEDGMGMIIDLETSRDSMSKKGNQAPVRIGVSPNGK